MKTIPAALLFFAFTSLTSANRVPEDEQAMLDARLARLYGNGGHEVAGIPAPTYHDVDWNAIDPDSKPPSNTAPKIKAKRQEDAVIEETVAVAPRVTAAPKVNGDDRVCEALRKSLETVELDIENPNHDGRDERALEMLRERRVGVLGTMGRWGCL